MKNIFVRMLWETVANKKFVIIGGNYFQNYRYFNNYKTSIKELFKCSIGICEAMNDYSTRIFGYKVVSSHFYDIEISL